MNVHIGAGVLVASVAFAWAGQAADANLDLTPAPGGPPIHVRLAQTSPDQPPISADIVLRRTSPTSAVLERNSDVLPLVIGPDGSLHLDATAQGPQGDLGDLLTALNIVHGVAAAAEAGNRSGWTAQIPTPTRSQPAGTPALTDPPPAAAPLVLPVHAVASATNGDLDIDGFVATSLPPPGSAMPHRSQRSHGGGFGGFGGGFGGFGGRGGSGEGGGNEPPSAAAPPIDLDIHVTGHIAHNALTRMTIAETRRVVLDGLTYSNAGNWTIDVLR